MNKAEVLQQLRACNGIKYGDFTLKSGTHSPIYIDLRILISYPSLLQAVSTLMWGKMQTLAYDRICGIPYTALPIATCISIQHNIPMVLARKEAKAYGTKNRIDGIFSPGQTCLMVEDVVTTGGSVMEAAQVLEEEGLHIRDVVAFVEREPAVRENFRARNYELHSVFTLSELL